MYKTKIGPQRVSQAFPVQAPTGGLNDLDPLSAMEASFMIESLNFFPDTGVVAIRPGYQELAVGFGAPVYTIMSYNAQDGSFKPFAATDIGIYDISGPPTNVPPKVKNVTNGLFEHTNYANTAGQFLVACNGFKTVFYNGTAWGDFTQVVTPAAPGEITGVNPNNFSFVLVHKGRLWFIEKNTMTAWYLPVDSMGGIAKPFFVGGLFKRGGYLTMLARWSADTGEGLDDRLVFMTSTGEIASYAGDDPSNAADWSLDSIYFIAPPLSARSTVDYGGNVLFLSRRGLVPLSSLVSSSMTEILYSNVLTRRISRTIIRYVSQPAQISPIEISIHPDFAWIAISLYDWEKGKPVQLVMNILTGAWGKFDYPAITMRTVDKTIYMGTFDGRVLLVTPDEYKDNVPWFTGGSTGVPIEAYAMCAFSYLDNPTANKHAKLMRPIFQAEVKPSFRMRALPDFRLDEFVTMPPPGIAVGNAKWDVAKWDLSNWASTDSVYRPWVSANVLGYAFAWQLRVSSSSRIGLAAVEWVYEAGGLV